MAKLSAKKYFLFVIFSDRLAPGIIEKMKVKMETGEMCGFMVFLSEEKKSKERRRNLHFYACFYAYMRKYI